MPNRDADPLLDATRGERLQKVLAAAGIESRRRCEELVAEGLVSVNGRIVQSLPAWVDPAEKLIVLVFTQTPRGDNPRSEFFDLVRSAIR